MYVIACLRKRTGESVVNEFLNRFVETSYPKESIWAESFSITTAIDHISFRLSSSSAPFSFLLRIYTHSIVL